MEMAVNVTMDISPVKPVPAAYNSQARNKNY